MTRILPLALVLGLAACGQDSSSDANNASNNTTNSNNTNTTNGGCVPDRAAWDAEMASIVQTHCATCHGGTPTYGAPQSLVTYEDLLVQRGDLTEAHLLATRVALGTMPPIGMPGVPDDEAEKLVQWASCGEQSLMPNSRLTSTAPVFLAPEDPPAGAQTIDMVANQFAVGEDVTDLYQCFTFDAGVDAEKFVKRIEVVEDKKDVLHHIVFLRDPQKKAPAEPHNCVGMPAGSDYLYAWAPGTGPIQFPEGGFRIRPDEQFVVQIHYNNGARVPNVRDSSGIRLYVDEPMGTEYGMIAPGPLAFAIPGKTVKDVTGNCVMAEDWKVLAGMPHMHENGSAFKQVIKRKDGTEEPFIALTNWSFETQLFYGLPVDLKAGDTLVTTCTFDNQSLGAVSSGPRTQDEMCFNFMYVTPPPSARYCDSSGAEFVTDIDYTPGSCAPQGGLADPALADGSFVVGTPAQLGAGELSDGVYELKQVQIWRDSADTPIGEIDLEASRILAKGQFVVVDGQAHIDMKISSDVVLTSGQRFGQNNNISLQITRDTMVSETLSGDIVCGQGQGTRANVPFEASATNVEIAFSGNAFGVSFESRYVFEKK
ncbi:MAG: hypothetical protein R3E66_03300 [bacterium]